MSHFQKRLSVYFFRKRARNKAKKLRAEKKAERGAHEAEGETDLSYIGGAREAEEARATADPTVRASFQAHMLQEITLVYFRFAIT